jgi:DMSO reductase family type II enzyme molybdopterin subunit
VQPPPTGMQRYRERLQFDSVAWGTHCANCLAMCPYRVFTKDGLVVYEEPAGSFAQIEDGVPDMNPMSCQKGAAWSQQLYSPDRLLYPLIRAGERGSGRWKRVSWDEALTTVADAIIDTIKEEGSESIVFEETTEGGLVCWASYLRFASMIGAISLDGNGLINDFLIGHYLTFGKYSMASSVDDTFHSKLILIWHSNPASTSIPYHHFISEARYHGAEVVSIAPDYNPSSMHADRYVPIKPGTDAALALGMCQVIVEEGLADLRFVKEQTDLSLLVRTDNGRFLRAADVQQDASQEHFYWWDAKRGLVPATRGTLELDGTDPVLAGTFAVECASGGEGGPATIEVTPVFALLKERLDAGYRPEQASEICGVHPEVIRDLARKAARLPTNILAGYNTPKYYHGDLMERAMLLLLGLTGNWGRKGSGMTGLCVVGPDGYFLFQLKQKPGLAETEQLVTGIGAAIEAAREQNPDIGEEQAGLQFLQAAASQGTSTPPFFFWYHHCGYREVWNNREWNDPEMPRPFDDYFREATEKGWWAGVARPGPESEPRVLFGVGTNTLRRTRGGRRMLLKNLWPKLRMIVSVDWRMSTTGAWSDVVLPAAPQFERANLQYTLTNSFRMGFSEQSAARQGESKSEWEIFRMLSEKVAERAVERGVTEFRDGRRQTRRLDNLAEQFTSRGAFVDEEAVLDEWIRDSSATGMLPPGTSLDTMRESGSTRLTGLGIFPMGLGVAADVAGDQTLTAFSWHAQKKVPYPTLTQRAQFYIDHPWFIEADEALPRHRDPPKMGGDYPLLVTSGHSRYSIHSTNMSNTVLLGTHRGKPICTLSPLDAEPRGIRDGDEVLVHNDCGSYQVSVKLSPSVRPGQVILYNGWEPFMHKDWKGGSEVEPGMIKWLHLVSRYGHLRYLPFNWQPVPSDRAVFVEVELARQGESATSNGRIKEAT